MHWIRELDEELVPDLSAVASIALGRECLCEVDLQNGDFRVVVTERISESEKAAVREAVLGRARELRPTLNDCSVNFKRPFPTTYTTHLAKIPQSVRPLNTPAQITTFNLPLSYVLSLREAERDLTNRANNAKRVVGFALGGVSTLSRLSMAEWEDLAPNPLRDGVVAYDLTAEKYHLFPGLNWRYEEGKQRFLDWLVSGSATGHTLIFDTGTEGNGARQIGNLLEAELAQRDLAAPIDIEIVGVVDGDDARQIQKTITGTGTNGVKYGFNISYLRVPCVLTEDFESLAGHKRLSRQGYLLPLRDTAIVRLVDDEGNVLQLSATDNLSDIFRGYMTNEIGGTRPANYHGVPALTPEMERILAHTILNRARQRELDDLHNAWSIGLVTEDQFRPLRHEVVERYDQECRTYPGHVWDLKKKCIVDGGS